MYEYYIFIYIIYGFGRKRCLKKEEVGKEIYYILFDWVLVSSLYLTHVLQFFCVGKSSIIHVVLWPPTRLHKNGPWAWNISLPGERILTAYTWFSTLCESIFHCFRLNVCSFALLKFVPPYGTWPIPQLLSVPCRDEWGSFILGYKKGACGPVVLHWLTGVLLAIGDWCPLLKLILLCLFSMQVKPCSFQCLTLSFSLVTLMPRYCGRSAQTSTPGDRQQMPLA